jgi:hypothetical protein
MTEPGYIVFEDLFWFPPAFWVIGEKYAGMDMISVGPQIEFPHSPDERIKVDTVPPFFAILTKTLERLAGWDSGPDRA